LRAPLKRFLFSRLQIFEIPENKFWKIIFEITEINFKKKWFQNPRALRVDSRISCDETF
jgi:hypothetical protein